MFSSNIFDTIFVFPILNVLILFYKIFLFIKLPGAFGFAIVALTIVVRAILHPFFKQQMETTKKMQDLKPHLDILSKKHKKDQKKFQQEQMKLFQQHGINPASGCLFMIIQFPIFIALYNTLSLLLKTGGVKIIADINKVLYSPTLHITSLEPWFLGFNLAQSPAQVKLWYYYLIPVITAALQYFQASATMPMTPTTPSNVENKDEDKKKSSQDDFQKAMGTQMKYFLPLMIGWFSYSLPVGLSLYWNIFSIFSIMQYHSLNKAKQISILKTKNG